MSHDSCTPNSTDLGNKDHVLRSSFNLFTQWPNCSIMVSTSLLGWLRSYLANRQHRTLIDGFASHWRYVPSGVPQGSIGPLLLLIFINEIADNISTDTSISLYVDDAKCYRKLFDPADQAILQSDLNTIEDWSELWGMSYNASKCKHLSFTGNLLSKSACEKDLGVLVNSKLFWHDHIVNKVN